MVQDPAQLLIKTRVLHLTSLGLEFLITKMGLIL